jgi:hypothetical protein
VSVCGQASRESPIAAKSKRKKETKDNEKEENKQQTNLLFLLHSSTFQTFKLLPQQNNGVAWRTLSAVTACFFLLGASVLYICLAAALLLLPPGNKEARTSPLCSASSTYTTFSCRFAKDAAAKHDCLATCPCSQGRQDKEEVEHRYKKMTRRPRPVRQALGIPACVHTNPLFLLTT